MKTENSLLKRSVAIHFKQNVKNTLKTKNTFVAGDKVITSIKTIRRSKKNFYVQAYHFGHRAKRRVTNVLIRLDKRLPLSKIENIYQFRSHFYRRAAKRLTYPISF